MPESRATDREVADALVRLLPGARWDVVAISRGFLLSDAGAPEDEAIAAIRASSNIAPGRARVLLSQARSEGLLASFPERKKKGSAENAAPKLFPARITEQRFADLVDAFTGGRPGVRSEDERDTGEYTYAEFALAEGEDRLPINVKNAGTRFDNAYDLVGLDPDRR